MSTSVLIFSLAILLLLAFAVWRYFFANRPRMSKSAWSPENQATHPSDYQNMFDTHSGVGEVKVRRPQTQAEAQLESESDVLAQATADEKAGSSADKNPQVTTIRVGSQSVEIRSARPNRSSRPEHSQPEPTGLEPAELEPEAFEEPDTEIVGEHEPEIIVLHVQSLSDVGFFGEDIMRAARDLGLSYVNSGVFHYFSTDEADNPWFTMADILEPGIIDQSNIEEFNTVGLSLFMQTEASPAISLSRFEVMLSTAHALARKLNGEVIDDARQPITSEKLHSLRQRIRAAFHQLEPA